MKQALKYDVLQVHQGANLNEHIEESRQNGWNVITATAMGGLHTIYMAKDDEDHVLVPKAALAWLFGEGPDAEGKHFGEVADEVQPLAGKYPRRYWWRSKFRSMIPALAVSNGERA